MSHVKIWGNSSCELSSYVALPSLEPFGIRGHMNTCKGVVCVGDGGGPDAGTPHPDSDLSLFQEETHTLD